MNKYIAFLFTGMVGTDTYEALWAENEEQAQEFANQMAIEHAESYGIYAKGWGEDEELEDDEGCYSDDIGASVELYDPEKHDMYRSGGGSFELDFSQE